MGASSYRASTCAADADGAAVGGRTGVADVNVVASGSDAVPGLISDSSVVASGSVKGERLPAAPKLTSQPRGTPMRACPPGYRHPQPPTRKARSPATPVASPLHPARKISPATSVPRLPQTIPPELLRSSPRRALPCSCRWRPVRRSDLRSTGACRPPVRYGWRK
jgi:hypothetical protein